MTIPHVYYCCIVETGKIIERSFEENDHYPSSYEHALTLINIWNRQAAEHGRMYIYFI